MIRKKVMHEEMMSHEDGLLIWIEGKSVGREPSYKTISN